MRAGRPGPSAIDAAGRRRRSGGKRIIPNGQPAAAAAPSPIPKSSVKPELPVHIGKRSPIIRPLNTA